MKPGVSLQLGLAVLCVVLASGCSHQQQQQQPLSMAPPVQSGQQTNYNQPAQPMNNQGVSGAQGGQPASGQQGDNVYQWQDVPQGQKVPITRATFDQGGYQIYAASGETIVVPFVNQNLYALKFGRTNEPSYFVNEGGEAPVLYLTPGSYLENAAAQNARWYPIPNDYSYSQPMYVSVAPSYSEFVAMGWYPGMNYYGGMWGYHPYSSFVWMPGFYIGIGGARYTTYTSYHTYYVHTPGYVRTTRVYTSYPARGVRTFGTSSRFRTTTTTTTRRSFGPSSSTTTRTRAFGQPGPSTRPGGFAPSNRTSKPFGSGTRPSGSSFNNGGRTSGGSFGGGRSSGSSFGGGRSSGSSFGGGRSSSGSFGGRKR